MKEELKPGRELDALIAEKVMRLVCPDPKIPGGILTPTKSLLTFPPYSTLIQYAWEVVDKIKHFPPKEAKEMGASLSIEYCDDGRWWCGWRWHEWVDGGKIGESAPHAICVAALWCVSNQ